MKWYFLNLLIAIDQLINAILGGWCDETLSSRSHRTNKSMAFLIDLIFLCFGDDNHCQSSFESERQRLQLPPEAR